MQIKRLAWDSDFFNYEVGKIEWSEKMQWDYFFQLASSSDYRVIYIFSDKELRPDYLNHVDRKTTLFRNLLEISPLNEDANPVESYRYDGESFLQLRELALESGVYSRFNVDPHFNNGEYQKLYDEWIKRSVLHDGALDCVVYREKGNVLAFATLEKKTDDLADIGLVAVHRSTRGKGIGSLIIEKALEKASILGFNQIQVVTQLANLPAMRLYRKCGFEVKRIQYIYHFWNL